MLTFFQNLIPENGGGDIIIILGNVLINSTCFKEEYCARFKLKNNMPQVLLIQIKNFNKLNEK